MGKGDFRERNARTVQNSNDGDFKEDFKSSGDNFNSTNFSTNF